MRITTLSLAAAFALGFTASAQAGGYAAPVVEVEPATPVVVEPAVGNWQGGYVGATLGYAFGGDDRIGLFRPADSLIGNLGDAELSGANIGVRVGYRWQRDRVVFGPELSYQGGDISDDFDFALGGVGAGDFESEVDSVLAIKFKTGYQVRPDTLIYGIAGYQKGDFTYSSGDNEAEYDADGYVIGLGAEKMVSERMSITGEYEYSDFGTTEVDVTTGGVYTNATPSFHNLKVGVNFKF